MLNVKIISSVWWRRMMSELETGDDWRPGKTVSDGTWRSFGPYHEDAQDKDQWRLRINEKLDNLGLPGKWPLQQCVCNITTTKILHKNCTNNKAISRNWSPNNDNGKYLMKTGLIYQNLTYLTTWLLLATRHLCVQSTKWNYSSPLAPAKPTKSNTQQCS